MQLKLVLRNFIIKIFRNSFVSEKRYVILYKQSGLFQNIRILIKQKTAWGHAKFVLKKDY